MYLVTGGGGFIGSNIVEYLLSRGERVRVLDNFSTGRRENLAPFVRDIELLEGDIRDAATAARAVQGAGFVLHQAALPSVIRSVKDPISANDVNVSGTLVMLVAARDAGVRRFVFASSSSVYGDSPTLPKREGMIPAPLSPYAVAKLTGEHYCAVFNRLYGLRTTALRYFNVFGPRQDPRSQYAAVIPNFFTAAWAGKPPVIYGDGTQSRDFTFVRNVAEANVLAAASETPGPDVLNIACGEEASLLDLLGVVAEITGREIRPRFEAARPGDVKHSLADISLAREQIKYRPSVTFREGLRIAAEHYRGGGGD